jgi:hypothetical protein
LCHLYNVILLETFDVNGGHQIGECNQQQATSKQQAKASSMQWRLPFAG